MASIHTLGNSIRAQVRRAGQPALTRTFSAKKYGTLAAAEKEAKLWAAKEELAFADGSKIGVRGKTGLTIGEAIDKYIGCKDHLAPSAISAFNAMKRFMGKELISNLSDQLIVDYIDSKEFGPATGAFHFSYLRSMLKMVRIGWNYYVPDVLDNARDRLKYLGMIGKSNHRDRRPTPEEIDRLLAYKWTHKVPMAEMISFAISSAMRRAEITRIEHHTFDKQHKTILITDRKHPTKKEGNNQIVPLLEESISIIERQPKIEFDNRIFPYTAQYVGELFAGACEALGIEDLHFHDLRHEGISRLFEMGYQIHEVAMFSGHDDWENLKRYTQLKAKDIRRLKTAKVEEAPKHVEGMGMDVDTAKQFKQFQAMLAMMKQTETA